MGGGIGRDETRLIRKGNGSELPHGADRAATEGTVP